jgi:hypothetical protein
MNMKIDSAKNTLAKVAAIAVIFSAIVLLNFTAASDEESTGVIELEKKLEDLPEDSPFRDQEARINSGAAAVEKKGNGRENYEILLSQNGHCFSLPQNMWVMMLAAYVFLLIFNLTYKLKEAAKLRWFWETLYTALALLAWYEYDACRTNAWFAQSVILIGAIIYFFYFYDFNKRLSPPAKKTELEKTAPLPFE